MLFRASLILAVLLTPAPLCAQERSLAKLLFGDVAIELRATAEQQLRVGAADSAQSVALTFRPGDVRRFVDTSLKLLPPTRRVARSARRARKTTPGRWTTIVEEPGVEAGSLSFNKTVDDSTMTWSLYIVDRGFHSLRVVFEEGEARAFLGAMRRAATALTPPPVRRAKKP